MTKMTLETAWMIAVDMDLEAMSRLIGTSWTANEGTMLVLDAWSTIEQASTQDALDLEWLCVTRAEIWRDKGQGKRR